MKKLFALALAAVLALAASLPALAAPELPDGKIYSVRGDDVFVVAPDGRVVVWGTNDTGLIPMPLVQEEHYFNDYAHRVTVLDGAVSLSGGYMNLFVIMKDGNLYGCGPEANFAYAYQKPRDHSTAVIPFIVDYHSPIKIMDDVAMVSGGYDTFTALKADGSVWTWGRDPYTDGFFGPVKILDGCKFISGNTAVKKNGALYAWSSVYSTPTMIKSGVFAAAYGLIQMKNGDLYEYESIYDGFPEEPVARNVRKLCPGGYITEDGALYTRLDSGEHVKLLDSGVESAFCAPYVYVAITEDGLVYASEIGSGYETLACVGTVDELAPEYPPLLNPWPLILGVANKIFELIPLLAPLI